MTLPDDSNTTDCFHALNRLMDVTSLLHSVCASGNELLAQTRSGTSCYYLYDGQGNVRALTNSNGVITDQYTYDAFGNLLSSSGSTVNPYRYTGQQFDSLTGLYDLRARYYDPTSGRFTSRDTAGIDFSNPVELNRYVYVADNPINFADPSGHLLAEEVVPNEVTVPEEEEVLPPESSFIERLLAIIIAALYLYHLLGPGAGPAPALPPGPTFLPLPAPTPILQIPPGATDNNDKWGVVAVWRGVDGKGSGKIMFPNPDLQPRQFKPRAKDTDGLSTFEYNNNLSGEKPYIVGMLIYYKPPKMWHTTGFVLGAPCAGTYTPEHGMGHWSINCVDRTGDSLSFYAKTYCRSAVFPNPKWQGIQPRNLNCATV